jgi:hypothetical protein
MYAALTGDAPYMALVDAVYDGRAPQGATFPYTVIGATTEVDEGDLDGEGWGLTLTLHDWSEYAGKKECQQIREARDALLHRTHLTVAGFGEVHVFREFAEILVDASEPDGPLRHGITRYRATAWAA